MESYERNGCAVARDPAFAKEALGPLIHSHAGVPGRSFLYREEMTFLAHGNFGGAGTWRDLPLCWAAYPLWYASFEVE